MKIVNSIDKVGIVDDSGTHLESKITRVQIDMTRDKRECVLTTMHPDLEVEISGVVLKPDFKSDHFLRQLTVEELRQLEKKVKNLIYVKKTKK